VGVLGSSANRRRAGDLPSDPGLGKVGAPKGLPEFLSVAHYETLRRTSISAPTPEAMSVRLAAKVTSGTSGAPPVLGSGVAVAVAVGLAVAVAVGVAVAVAVGVAVAVAVAIGLAVAVAVGLAVAVAVAMGLAVAPP
jgi:hypothetical protein